MSGTRAVVKKPVPVLLSSGSVTQTVDQNKPITDIRYTAANATIALSSGTASLPTGISGTPNGSTFTISGTPTAAGTFNYTVTAAHTDGGCTSTLSGAITVKAGIPTYAASTQTWTVSGTAGTQTWSDVINIPACDKTTYSANNTTADCRSSPGYGHLYSWTYVVNNASTLCDNGWRVPTEEDFCTLDKIVNNSTTCDNSRSGVYGADYTSKWGCSYGGYCYDASIGKSSTAAFYWSSTAYSNSDAICFRIDATSVIPAYVREKTYGFGVRCMR
jgi:uncharacterized protein (TIGR02145 family)